MRIDGFLLARIAEDEAVARAATHQKIAGPSHGSWNAGSALLMVNDALGKVDRQHIARWDPTRVLAECAANRRVVTTCGAIAFGTVPSAALAMLVLQEMSMAYVDHPDYDEAWRP